MIKVTTTNAHSMFCIDAKPMIDISKYSGLTNIPKHINTYIYLHGSIQDEAGFDIPVFLEGEYVDEGIHDIEVLLPSKTVACKMMLWKDITPNVTFDTGCETLDYGDLTTVRGLIVDNNDKASMANAMEKYNKKVQSL